MKKKLITICAMLSVILLSTSVATAIITVDPDPTYNDGDNISNAFASVTLSAVGDGWNNPDGDIYAQDPTIETYPFDPSTGDLVFGTNDGWYPHVFWGKDLLRFRADFAVLATEVSLDFIGNDPVDPKSSDGDIGELKAYDAGDNLLDSAFTGVLYVDDDPETLTVSDPGGIAYILAYGNSTDTLGLDNMQWEPIPAPGAILLGSLGVGLVGWLRRRRTL